MAGTMPSGDCTAASGDEVDALGKAAVTPLAASTARRVLPLPPGPTSVSSRQSGA